MQFLKIKIKNINFRVFVLLLIGAHLPVPKNIFSLTLNGSSLKKIQIEGIEEYILNNCYEAFHFFTELRPNIYIFA